MALVSGALARCLLAGALGMLWHLGAVGIACSPLVLVLWRQARTRIEGGALAACYHGAAAAPALWGVYEAGYADLSGLELAAMAGVATLVVSGVWVALWSRSLETASVSTTLRVLLLVAITALPGVGVIGLQSPLTAAGLYFPGTRWMGLLGVVALICVFPRRWSARAAALLALGGLFAFWAYVRPANDGAPAIVAQSTRLAIPEDLHDYYRQALVAMSAQEELHTAGDADVVVLPEGVGGLWTTEMQALWSERPQHGAMTVVLGATLPIGDHFDNAVVALSALGTASVPQRVPMPGVMWRPWRATGTYRAHWLDSGVLALPHHRLGVVVCYEQMLVFPVLWSVASGADILVGLSNLAVFRGDSLGRWQRDALRSWGVLFGIPVAIAMNAETKEPLPTR